MLISAHYSTNTNPHVFEFIVAVFRNSAGKYWDFNFRVWRDSLYVSLGSNDINKNMYLHLADEAKDVGNIDPNMYVYTGTTIAPSCGYYVEAMRVVWDNSMRWWLQSEIVESFLGVPYVDPVVANAPPLTLSAQLGGALPFDMTKNFYRIEGITVSNDFIFVADPEMNRVVKLGKSDFSYIGAIGSGNNTSPLMVGGTWGAFSADELYRPSFVANDGTYLYVLETLGLRLEKRLMSDMSFVNSFGYYYVSLSAADMANMNAGTGLIDLLVNPEGICTDGTYLYVLDNCRVIKLLCSDLSFVAQHGSPGSGNDQFGKYGYVVPNSIAYNNGYVYVSDPQNLRIVKLNATDLTYVSQVSTGGSVGGYSFDRCVGYLFSDGIYLYTKFNDGVNDSRLEKRSLVDMSFIDEMKIENAVGQYTSDLDRNNVSTLRCVAFDSIDMYVSEDVAGDSYYEFVVVPGVGGQSKLQSGSNSRITVRNKSDFTQIMRRFGGAYVGDNEFNYPYGVACDNTYLYITDSKRHMIDKRLKSDLSLVTRIGTWGTTNNDFNNPKGITYYGGFLYICDYGNNRILKYDAATLSYIGQVSETAPLGIACDGTYVYVTSYTVYPALPSHRVIKRLASDLSFVAEIGGDPMSDNTHFNYPEGITSDGTYVFVGDKNRVTKRLCSDLSFVSQYGHDYTTFDNDTIDYPTAMANDNDNIYFTDFKQGQGSVSQRIMVRAKSDLSYVAKVGNLGMFPNNNPSSADIIPETSGICLDGDYVYFTELFYHQIQKRLKSVASGGFSVRNILVNQMNALNGSLLNRVVDAKDAFTDRLNAYNYTINRSVVTARDMYGYIYGMVGVMSTSDNFTVSNNQIFATIDNSVYFSGGRSIKISLTGIPPAGCKVVFANKADGNTVDLSRCGTVGFQVYSMVYGSYLKLRLSEDGTNWFETTAIVNSSIEWTRWEASIMGMASRSAVKYVEIEYMPAGASMNVSLIQNAYGLDAVNNPSIWIDNIEGVLSPLLNNYGG